MDVFWGCLADFLDRWQNLIGSFLGASVPIAIWFLGQKRKEKDIIRKNRLLAKREIDGALKSWESVSGFLERISDPLSIAREKASKTTPIYFHTLPSRLISIDVGDEGTSEALHEAVLKSHWVGGQVGDVQRVIGTGGNSSYEDREFYFKKVIPSILDHNSEGYHSSLKRVQDYLEKIIN